MLNLPNEFKEIVSRDARVKYFSRNPLKNRLLRKFFEKIFNMIMESNQDLKSVLEVGCGDGIAGYLMKNRFKDIDYLGADIKINNLLVASKVLKNDKFVLLDGRNLPLKENSFDVVICLEVFEHLKNWEELLKEIIRAAKIEVIFSVPVFPSYQLSNFVFGKNLKRFGEHPDHVNQFRMGQLKSRINELLGSRELKGKIKQFDLFSSFPWCIGRINIQG